MGQRYCDVDECLDEARSNGKCWAHAKQAQRGVGTRPVRRRLSRKGEVVEAILAVAEADAERETAFRAAWARFMYHGRKFFLSECEKCGRRQDCPKTGRG